VSALSLHGIVKRFGPVPVIHGVDLSIERGEFIVFVGPSGCGKSTLLRIVAGLEQPTAGEIRMDGDRVNEVQAAQRGIAMVFQSYALYPHMTVYSNMAFGLETARMPKEEIRRRVTDAAKLLKLDMLLDRKPKALSGGQRQRVAIGRAIVRQPKLFLFDEPLSNLDAELRVQMRVEIAKLHRSLGVTSIYVTHDQVEAMTMADRIVVLEGGVVQQVGSPLELYNRPANRFVAGFLGSPRMNLLDGAAKAGVFEAGGVTVACPGLPDGPAALGVRPEQISLDGDLSLPVTLAEQLGDETIAYLALPGGQTLVVKLPGQKPLTPGDKLPIRIDPAHCHFFGADGRAITG
jgi:multiple sugar transport system ATP-binding protein